MSWLTSHCRLLTCVISVFPGEITSLWPEIRKDFQGTGCYLAPVTCVNKQTNQEMVPCLWAPQPFLLVLVDNSSATVGTGRIPMGVDWLPGDPCAADSLHVLHSWQ